MRCDRLCDDDIFAEIPLDMRTDILMLRYKPTFDKVNLFENKDIGFIRSIVSRLQSRVLMPGDFAMKARQLISYHNYYVTTCNI